MYEVLSPQRHERAFQVYRLQAVWPSGRLAALLTASRCTDLQEEEHLFVDATSAAAASSFLLFACRASPQTLEAEQVKPLQHLVPPALRIVFCLILCGKKQEVTQEKSAAAWTPPAAACT